MCCVDRVKCVEWCNVLKEQCICMYDVRCRCVLSPVVPPALYQYDSASSQYGPPNNPPAGRRGSDSVGECMCERGCLRGYARGCKRESITAL